MACILVMSTALVFTSCEKVKGLLQENDSSTGQTTEQNALVDDGYSDGNVSGSENPSNEQIELFGEWFCDQNIAPQAFYSDFYNAEITKTNVNMRTLYEFRENGTFVKKIEIVNISEVRKEYRSLMVEAGRTKLKSQGKILTTDDVLYYESYADEVLDSVCTVKEGTYVRLGNKLIYTIGGESFSETFTFDNDKLVITGSSVSNAGFPMTFTKK